MNAVCSLECMTLHHLRKVTRYHPFLHWDLIELMFGGAPRLRLFKTLMPKDVWNNFGVRVFIHQ